MQISLKRLRKSKPKISLLCLCKNMFFRKFCGLNYKIKHSHDDKFDEQNFSASTVSFYTFALFYLLDAPHLIDQCLLLCNRK
jgi:hypothetical protein